jgi:hypothetical protein
MDIPNKIAYFFEVIDEIWEVVPNYAKVFLFSCSSSIIGLHYTGELTSEAVLAILFVNLGLYSIPRASAEISKKLR